MVKGRVCEAGQMKPVKIEQDESAVKDRTDSNITRD
jgi:hypothetical protein